MATQFLVVFLLLSCYALTSVTGQDTNFGTPLDPNTVDFNKTKQLTYFKFYRHDIVGGSNATSVTIIPPLPGYNSTIGFGLVRIIDNALTLGPELSSKLVGRAEGFYASTSQTELDLLVIQTFTFFEGKYNDSSINLLGSVVALNKTRELPVVGGTGVFRFAKGYAELSTYSYDPNSKYTIIEYNLYVYHYF